MYHVNKNLRPAAVAAVVAAVVVAAAAAAYEPVQKHKVTPGIPGWRNNSTILTEYVMEGAPLDEIEKQKENSKQTLVSYMELSYSVQ